MCESCGCEQHGHEHLHLLLPVKGMTCEHCAANIEKTLNALPGVHATADFKLGAVSLLLHEDADLAKAKEAILDLGFEL